MPVIGYTYTSPTASPTPVTVDLGDVVGLTFNTYDDTGALADAGAVSLTITLPDSTTTSPAVGNSSQGVYWVDYTTVQAGLHRVDWVATGTNAAARTDVFYVFPANPGLLISLAEARAALGTPGSNTAKDEDLRLFIMAATPMIEDLIGPCLSRSLVETHDGGGPTIATLFAPLISVTSIIESYGGNYEKTLGANNLFDGSALDAYGYTVDLDSGVITRRVAGVPSIFPTGRRNVQVTYTAGRSTLQGNHLLAARRLVRHLWQSEQQGYRPQMGAPDSPTGYTPSGFAVPRAVIELCSDSARVPGIG